MQPARNSDLSRYAQDLATRGELNIDRISREGMRRLESEGIRPADLERIAGADRVIRGEEFRQVFGLLEGNGADRAGRSTDVGRAQRIYDSLSREVDHSAAAPAARSPAIGGAGLRDEINQRGRGTAGRPQNTYAPNDLPGVNAGREAPTEKCWFVAMLECIFQWVPGVNTDSDRLKTFGRDLADQHESDIRAFYDANERRTAAGPANNMGVRTPDPHGAMVTHLADRLQAEAKSHGQSLSRSAAESRAETIVSAMETRLEQRRTASMARAGQIPGVSDPTNGNARSLAARYFPAREAAQALGAPWTQRLDRAMATPPANHPTVAGHPTRPEEARNAAREENVKSVSYLMALQRSGQLSNVPADAIEGLLAAQQAGLINAEAVAETANALQNLPAAERARTLDTIRSVPADRRDLAWGTLAREHLGLRTSDPVQRAGSFERINRASAELGRLNVAAARSAFDQGTLGLIETQLPVHHRVGGRDVTTNVPVFIHPSVPDDQREHLRGMVAEAYGRIPQPALQAMLRGEGGRPFSVQLLPEGSLHSGIEAQQRPDPDSAIGGYFRVQDNVVRLNTHEMLRAESQPTQGRDHALGYILHESTHYLDDLGDADQMRGFFIDHDAARVGARTQGDGDLAPSWSHFERTTERHRALTGNLDEPLAREYAILGRRSGRSAAEEKRFHVLERHFAALSGTVSSYGAAGGDSSIKSRGINLGEWFAETNANYMNPARRDHLRSVDPVGYQMVARYNDLLTRGVPPPDALRQAARFSLSTEVAAQQGTRMLTGAGTNPLSADQRRDLAGITEAFENHGRALDGWQPYRKDAGLITMRKDEALAGAREGRTLIGKVDQRLATLNRSSAEFRELTALRTRLDRAVTQLETRANAL